MSLRSSRSHSITEFSFPTAAFSAEDGLCWQMGTEAAEKEFQSPYFHLANRPVDTNDIRNTRIRSKRCTARCLGHLVDWAVPRSPSSVACGGQQQAALSTTKSTGTCLAHWWTLNTWLIRSERKTFMSSGSCYSSDSSALQQKRGKTFVKTDSPSKPTGRTCHHSASLDVCLPMPKWLRSYQRMTSRSWST